MTPHGGVLLEAWCQLLYDGLVAGGVATVVVSPGSRSTPLVLAASGRADLEVVTVVDERAAAFYALGRARAEGRPLALVRTSGSAAGHDLPAVIEARAAGVPLVVLTADRPHELMDARAPQTIDQLRLFGEQAVGFFDLGLPDPTPRALRAVRRVGMQAAELAKHPRPGAVQVNVRARKPLEAPATEGPGEAEFRTDVEQLREEGAPEVKSLDDLRAAFASARRPLLVAGPAPVALASELETQRSQLRALGVPVVIEATSQLRFGPGGLGAAGLEAVLRHEAWRRCLEPDLVVQLGEPPVSTGLQRALSEWSSARWAVAPRGYPDPDSRSHVVRAERGPALEALVAASREEGFLDAWRRAEAAAAAAVEEGSSPTPPGEELSEGIVTRWARDAVPAGGRLMVGNSLAVRHLDLYLPPGGSALDVLHQRGASGIDGLIAGAIGASQASPCVLLLGDVSARHDLGALALGTLAGELTVVVLHNGGGRIFEQLPLARQLGDGHPQLEPFLTEDARSLVPVAEALGWTATRVGTTSELREALAAGPSPRLIEAEVPPHGARDDMEGFVRSAAAALSRSSESAGAQT